VQKLEQERDQWEGKYEVRRCLVYLGILFTLLPQDMKEQRNKIQKEMDELASGLDNL
jgi:hypothetical protein